ncbi:hypothetical protein [Streptomyces sp. NPDC058613]|uniref:hypothetical protein n=1 Tax=unclassified Streptomyces TaxID=2593676 RepID=UPI003666D063
MAVFLFVILIAIVLGLIGIAAESLSYLLIIGIILLIIDVAFFSARRIHRSRKRPIR